MSSVVSLQDLLRITQRTSTNNNIKPVSSIYDSSVNDSNTHSGLPKPSANMSFVQEDIQTRTAAENVSAVEDMGCHCRPFITGTDLDTVLFYSGRVTKPYKNNCVRSDGNSNCLNKQPLSQQQHRTSYYIGKRFEVDNMTHIRGDTPRLATTKVASVPGIPCGAFVELCGHSGCGKTMVCLAATVEALSENFVWKEMTNDDVNSHCEGTVSKASTSPQSSQSLDLYRLPTHQSTHVVWVSSHEGYTTLPFSPSLLLDALQERLLSKKRIEIDNLSHGIRSPSSGTDQSDKNFSLKTPILDNGLPSLEAVGQYLHVLVGVHSPSRLSTAIQLTIPKLLRIEDGNDVLVDTHNSNSNSVRSSHEWKSAAHNELSGEYRSLQGRGTRSKAPSFQPAWKKQVHTPSPSTECQKTSYASHCTAHSHTTSLPTTHAERCSPPARVLIVIDSLSDILGSHELTPSSVMRTGTGSYVDVKKAPNVTFPTPSLSKSVIGINRYNFLIQEMKNHLQQLMTEFLSRVHVDDISHQQGWPTQHPINTSCMSFLYTNGITSTTSRTGVSSDHPSVCYDESVDDVQHQKGGGDQYYRPITTVRPSGGPLWCSLATYTALMDIREEWDSIAQDQCFNQTFHPVQLDLS